MKIELGFVLVVFGVLLIAHARQRRQGWWRVSAKPIPWWVYFVYGQGPKENPSDRDLERQGTNTEMAAGVLSAAIGIAAIVAYA